MTVMRQTPAWAIKNTDLSPWDLALSDLTDWHGLADGDVGREEKGIQNRN